MGTLKVSVSLDVSGPLADGRAEKAVEDWQERTTQALAAEAVKMLGDTAMDKSGRASGAFREHLKAVTVSPGEASVPGPMIRGVVWAPWLEGTSTRNKSTQFRGYKLFAKTRAELNQRATDIAQRELDAVIAEMGE